MAGLGGPALDNQPRSEASEGPDGQSSLPASQAGSFAKPAWASLLQPTSASDLEPQGPPWPPSSGAGQTQVSNVLASFSDRSSNSSPPQPWPQPWSQPWPEAQSQARRQSQSAFGAPTGGMAGAQAPASPPPPNAPHATALASAPSLVAAPAPSGISDPARAAGPAAPRPAGAAGSPGPSGKAIAQRTPALSGAAAASAARALSHLAGEPARSASPGTVPGSGVGADLAGAPATSSQAAVGAAPDAQETEIAEVDPHTDDILPAKSKSFFRLRLR